MLINFDLKHVYKILFDKKLKLRKEDTMKRYLYVIIFKDNEEEYQWEGSIQSIKKSLYRQEEKLENLVKSEV